ncbi:hypothetical protein [Mycolicibacterium vaccae]|uniref:hypothetical protein n=1 Tax=Mycolicibacterium vaccae TaxID=1810 RepID=UPI003D087899
MRREALSAGLAGAAVSAALLVGAPSAAGQPAPVEPPAPAPAAPVAEGVPHLASPENLPPGTAAAPVSQSRLDYWRDLWHAMRTQEVSGSNALLLLTQRPMTAGPPALQPVAPPPPPAAPAPPVAPAP